MLPAPPANWKDAHARRAARLRRKAAERAKRWRKPRRPGSPVAGRHDHGFDLPGRIGGDAGLDHPLVAPGRAYSDTGELAIVRRPRLISDQSDGYVGGMGAGPASPSSGTGTGIGSAWDGEDTGTLAVANQAHRAPAERPAHRQATPTGHSQRRMSTPAFSPVGVFVAPARSRAISFDPEQVQSMRSPTLDQ